MKKTNIAIDLGTTNTVVAQWNDEFDGPEIIHLDSICRNAVKDKDIDDSYTIPSCVYLLSPRESYPFPLNFLFKNFRSKTRGLIGMQALERDGGTFRDMFVNNFKSHLGKHNYQFIGTLKKWKYTAEDITRIFLNSLFSEIKKILKIKPTQVTFCVPVDFYEVYRALLQRISSKLKIKIIKTIDEPVAAALGYGLNIGNSKNILVIDFGAGTIDFALVKTAEKLSERGKCHVVAKEGAPVGGNLVDAWIVEELCEYYSYNFDRFSKEPGIRWWYRMLQSEACRLKEILFFKDKETFYLMPSKLMSMYAKSIPGNRKDLRKPVDFTKKNLISLLEKKGLYTIIDNLLSNILELAKGKGIRKKDIDEVLMVGGSTLLPNVYSLVEKRFGRDRVRAWQPFNAVAFGAAAYAENRFHKSDHVTHDYALLTYDKKSYDPEYNVIVPAGTSFPTPKDIWKRQLSPTCALGEPERIFKLIICEIGKKHSFDQEFVWDEKGELHHLDDGPDSKQLIIPLNELDPTLGYLSPPHYPSDKRARVEVSFMINEDRWLCSTVYDLKTNKYLLVEKPVIRLK